MLIIDMPKKYLTDASGCVSCFWCQKYLPLLYRNCHNDSKGCLIKGELPDEHGDLIDRDALRELMRTYDDYQGAKEAHDLELIHRDSILFAIETAPTVDAVQVVRCRECKWCEYPVPNSTKYGCRLFDRCVKGDWFCADGERRTE